jgi:hypothetical protein
MVYFKYKIKGRWRVKQQSYEKGLFLYHQAIPTLNEIIDLFNLKSKTPSIPYVHFKPYEHIFRNEDIRNSYIKKYLSDEVLPSVRMLTFDIIKEELDMFRKKDKLQIYYTICSTNIEKDVQFTKEKLELIEKVCLLVYFMRDLLLCSTSQEDAFKHSKYTIKKVHEFKSYIEEIVEGWQDFYELQSSSLICKDILKYLVLPYLN